MEHHLSVVLILTVGFALASLLGYCAQRLRLPPILGYLLAGYLIGPYSPGFVADISVAEQLAEIGVILMLFNVGLHFKLEDLINVKNIAIPGAIIQTLSAAAVTAVLIYYLGWSLESGVILGLAVGVASTVVLVRVLTDHQLLDTQQGHIAVGWLIVEDILTVAVLLLLPIIGTFFAGGEVSKLVVTGSILFMLLKFAILIGLMFTLGQKVISYILTDVARLRSHELFTLTVLALVFLIATGSAWIFGTSIALGAFIAGMVIHRTTVRHQAAANALPLKDTFTIIFFLSVGMLFNPKVIVDYFGIFIALLSVILIVKPLVALLIVLFFNYSWKVAFTVAFALAQIGEFSFILAEEARFRKMLPAIGFDVLVACALITISINPLFFRLIDTILHRLKKKHYLHRLDPSALSTATRKVSELFKQSEKSRVIVVGFGPIGQEVTYNLTKSGVIPIVIELNVDTVASLENQRLQIIFGDATQPNILEAAKIDKASMLIITLPETKVALEIIKSARHLNPNIRILTRVHYLSEQKLMEEMGVNYICSEKEAAKAFRVVMHNLLKKVNL